MVTREQRPLGRRVHLSVDMKKGGGAVVGTSEAG